MPDPIITDGFACVVVAAVVHFATPAFAGAGIATATRIQHGRSQAGVEWVIAPHALARVGRSSVADGQMMFELRVEGGSQVEPLTAPGVAEWTGHLVAAAATREHAARSLPGLRVIVGPKATWIRGTATTANAAAVIRHFLSMVAEPVVDDALSRDILDEVIRRPPKTSFDRTVAIAQYGDTYRGLTVSPKLTRADAVAYYERNYQPHRLRFIVFADPSAGLTAGRITALLDNVNWPSAKEPAPPASKLEPGPAPKLVYRIRGQGRRGRGHGDGRGGGSGRRTGGGRYTRISLGRAFDERDRAKILLVSELLRVIDDAAKTRLSVEFDVDAVRIELRARGPRDDPVRTIEMAMSHYRRLDRDIPGDCFAKTRALAVERALTYSGETLAEGVRRLSADEISTFVRDALRPDHLQLAALGPRDGVAKIEARFGLPVRVIDGRGAGSGRGHE